jgi:hypothetical protein
MKEFIKQIFSESDGQGSMTRVLMFLVIACSLTLLSIITVKNGFHLPDYDTLIGLAAFDTAICGSLYGTNQAGDILSSIKGLFHKDDKSDPVTK